MSHGVICPTVTAFNAEQYSQQMHKVALFADRVHIDMMDGEFAPTKSPPLDKIWWPTILRADIHLMYQKPMDHLNELLKLRPHMVIVHTEAQVHHMHFAAELHKHEIKTGLAILQDTPIEHAYQVMHSFDQILIFSGNLGHHGGSKVDFGLLDKVKKAKEHHPEAEIAWDGGVNDSNALKLVEAGVDVLNVGGYIHQSKDPQASYGKLLTLAENKNDDSRT